MEWQSSYEKRKWEAFFGGASGTQFLGGRHYNRGLDFAVCHKVQPLMLLISFKSYTMPCAIMAFATFMKPAMFAPLT